MKTINNSLRSGNKPETSMKIMIVEDEFIEAYDLQLILERASYNVCGIARSVDEALTLLEAENPELVLVDIFLKGKLSGIDLANILKERKIGFIFVSANSSRKVLDEAKTTQPYGFIVKPFREQDILITIEIAFFRHKYSLETQMYQQLQIQSELESIIKKEINREEAFTVLAKVFQPHIPFDYIELNPVDGYPNETIGLLTKKVDEYQLITDEKLAKIADLPLKEIQTYRNELPTENTLRLYTQKELVSIPAINRLIVQNFGIKSYITMPFSIGERLFNLSFYSRMIESQDSGHLSILYNLEFILNTFIEKFFLKTEQEPLPTNIRTESRIPSETTTGFDGIIGNSQEILKVFDYIKRVAPSDTSVLILGESGTGKEKIASAIHKMSPRKDKQMIVVDCSTVPHNLVESLLFGHEKGSFTGATEKKIGKFEIADGGTIFLDEIGELPIELQIKLLRVLQEKEIERVGGNFKIKVDVRIIAATNRNLEEEISAGRFRMDLYYRLHVFPIIVPPLQERIEDIPLLVSHFIKIYGHALGKQNAVFSETAMSHLLNYSWPGNIRELEHVVQRSLLLADKTIMDLVDLPGIKETKKQQSHELAIKTISENERDYIIYILQKCKGKISGVNGAAELLDIHPSTLNAKLKKLGIKVNLYS